MRSRFALKIAVLTLGALLLLWGVKPGVALSGPDEAGSSLSNETELASATDDADLSRESEGETSEHDSHEIGHETADEHEIQNEIHSGESDHESVESDHTAESEHGTSGGSAEGGGGESGADH